MGQPSIIYKVNGSNGCTIGAEIGRDRLICVLLDFDGAILARWSRQFDFPRPDEVVPDIASFMSSQLQPLAAEQRAGFLGVGVAMPWFLGEWREELGIADSQALEWSGEAVANRFRSELEGPVFFENDGN